MEIKHHNKLVRDDILLQLSRNGVDYTAKTVKGQAHYRALLDKLQEEVNEVKNAATRKDMLEELADVVEVCYAAARSVGYTSYDIEKERVIKLLERGSFDNGDYLLTTKRGEDNA